MVGIWDYLTGQLDAGIQKAGSSFAPDPSLMDEEARRTAGAQSLLALGSGLLANADRGFAPALGAGLQGLQQVGQQSGINALRAAQYAQQGKAYKLQEQQLARKIQEDERQKQALEGYLSTLPPDQQALARANPELALKSYYENQKPVKPGDRLKVVGNTLYDIEAGRPVYQAPQVYAPTTDERQLTAMGLRPGSPEYQRAMYELATQPRISGFDPATGQAIISRPNFPMPGQMPAQGAGQVAQEGYTPTAPVGPGSIGTVQLGQPKLSEGQQKRRDELETELQQAEQGLADLTRAEDLNTKRYSGMGAPLVNFLGRTQGTGTASNTDEFTNLMSQGALQKMADNLKGATSDRDIALFLSLAPQPTDTQETARRKLSQMRQIYEGGLALKKQQYDRLTSGNSSRTGNTITPTVPPRATEQPKPASNTPPPPPGFVVQ